MCLTTAGIEDGVGAPNADTRVGEPDVYAAAVGLVALARDIPVPLEPVDRERHRARCHTHVSREIGEDGCLDGVQVVEDAHLMGAD